jgi:hypothetical protein
MATKSTDTKDPKKVKIGGGGGIKFGDKDIKDIKDIKDTRDTKDTKKVKLGGGGGIRF